LLENASSIMKKNVELALDIEEIAGQKLLH
jgi:hypothetical protein